MACRRAHSLSPLVIGLALAGSMASSWRAMAQPSIPLTPAAQASGAQITYDQGIEFVTVGAAGNAPYQTGRPNAVANGRGGVGYDYRIGRVEVTTSQWVEFFNAAYDRPAGDRLPFLLPPNFWGAQGTTPNTPGGLRWRVPAGNELAPVGNISWRMAAMYCNWLTNDKRTDRAAFLSGAYDVSTFGTLNGNFTDQAAHAPGARYWIPTWDEWLKAAHFDPNRNGPAQGGWWQYSVTSDTAPAYGPPGEHVRTSGPAGPDPSGPLAQANAGWTVQSFPNVSPFSVLLGSYPTVQSPWGLLDTAGGSTEWTESIRNVQGDLTRFFDGSYRGSTGLEQASLLDSVSLFGDDLPSIPTLEFGFRIASAVPAPGAGVLMSLTLLAGWRGRAQRPATPPTKHESA